MVNKMLPEEKPKKLDLWILIQTPIHGSSTYSMNISGISPYGSGFYASEQQAKEHQLVEMIKGNKMELFHLEMPI